MRYPTGLENIVRTATLTATNTVPSSAHELVSRDADGGGTVRLGGSYSGGEDAVVDIEIISNTINGVPRISTPVYAGVGNGAISNVEADSGIAAQVFTVTCIDAGIPTRQAWAPFQSVNLRAQASGSGGNALSLQVSQAGLTATATDYAVTAEIPADTSELVGDQFNFGAVTLEPEGTVPTSAPRIRFGDDVTVYRHWRVFREGRYRYHFSPALQRAVPVGTRVYAITGGRTVELLDGATVEETFTGVTTLYSLLSQIAASSTLIEVDGVIAQDRRPGGMACDDLSVYTASYSAGSVRDGSEFIDRAVVTLTVPGTAPTETLTLRCIGAQIPGAEIWELSGTVSAALGTVVSGETLTAAGYSVTVPRETAPGEEPAGTVAYNLDLLARAEGARIPSLCVENFLMGAEAQDKTYVYEWRPHPGEECDCSSIPVYGGPNPIYLGTDSGGTAVANLPAAIKTLYDEVEDWRLQSLHLNCYFSADDDDTFLTSLVAGINAVIQANTTAPTETLTTGIVSALFQRASAIAKFEQADIDAIELTANTFQQHLVAIEAEMSAENLELALVEFQTQWDFIVDKLTPLMVTTNDGGLMWKTTAFSQLIQPAEVETNPLAVIEAWIMQAIKGARNLTNDLGPLTKMIQACIGKVYIAGNLLRPFDSAGRQGNGVWQDHDREFWFVSEDGLLPLQPGWYYHSARMARDEDGREVPVATGEFGIGVAIGCEDLLRVGDKLILRTVPVGNARSTYQQGDYIAWEIIRADPVALGGGQTGDDTITFGVRGSAVGALADYALVTTAPAGYDDGGLSFTIEPGGIPPQPGDRWTFSAEGGEFRARINSGGWTTYDIASSVSLGSGITAEFISGATPSWVVGDLYQLKMLATNGVGRARAPDDESMAWTGSTQIDLTPSGAGTADTLLIAAHTIASTATVTLLGSNDNWATNAFSQVVPWAAGSMALLFASTTCAKWRLTVNESGSADWIYLGVPERPIVQGTAATVEHGEWRRSMRLANGQRTRAIGGTVVHTDCDSESVDGLLTAFEYAHENDDSRIGAISPEGEAVFCTVGDVLELEDAYGFQPPAEDRRVGFSLTLTPR